jgi:hypothetical protein
MAIFVLTLQPTYFKQGFFNVVRDFDRYVRSTDGPVRLRLEPGGIVVEGKVNRSVNQNGTARVLGGTSLRDWFQANFEPMDKIAVDLSTKDVIVLSGSQR